MVKTFLMRASFLLLIFPAAVSAAALDDYYLSKFGEKVRVARVLSDIAPGEAEHCLTPLYRKVKRDWPLLEPVTQQVLAKQVWSRPILPELFQSPGGRFNIRYTLSGPDSILDLTDADPQNGVPDWVEKVASVFEHVYDEEVSRLGYRPPPVAVYDVYLMDLLSKDAYGFTSDDGAPIFPATSSASYIGVDRAFEGYPGVYDRVQLLQVTAAHEFHHAIQFGYNYYFDYWYAEVTATWIEDEIYDSVNQLYSYLPAYLPRSSTLSLDAPLGGNSEYGRWIFNRYLAERHSPSLIKDVWVKLGSMPAPPGGNDIPMLPVISTVLEENGNTISGALLGFARKLYLQDWAATHAADIPLIPAVAPRASYSDYPVNLSAINAQIAVLPKSSFAYYKFLPGQTAPAELTLTLAAVPAGFDIVAIKKGTNGSVDEYSFDRASGTVTVPLFNAVTTSEVQLIICNSTSTPAPVVAAPVSSSNSSGGGGCFIATAAYGSYLHPKVAELRTFRDRYLLTNAPGRLFVSLYYRLSPPVARVIAEHEWMRGGVRLLLVPVVLAVENPGGALLVLMLSGGGAVFGLARRRRSIGPVSVSSAGAH